MKRIIQKLFAAAIICALAGFVFCAVNQQQWVRQLYKEVQNFEHREKSWDENANVTITRSYKTLGLGLFILSGALMVTGGLVINRYGYATASAPAENSTPPATINNSQ